MKRGAKFSGGSVAVAVGPGSDAGEVEIGAVVEEGLEILFGRGLDEVRRYESDCLVPECTPGVYSRCCKKDREGDRRGELHLGRG